MFTQMPKTAASCVALRWAGTSKLLRLCSVALLATIMQSAAAERRTAPSLGGRSGDEDGERVNGTLLVSLALGDQHEVACYEFEPGVVALRESRAAEKGGSGLGFKLPEDRSLPAILRTLAPSQPIPAALVQAEQRAQQRALRQVLSGAEKRDAEVCEPAPMSLPKSGEVHTADWDWSADALWFLANFCSTGHRQWCPYDVAWAWSERYNVSFFQTSGMAAAFELPAHFTGDYWSCSGASCDWVRAWDERVNPRWIRTWVFTSRNHYKTRIDGTGPTARVHLAVLHED
ncbi:hypothetical protein [Haliangium sp. UPWRP_2]|uniref:hypothetical protein n=1 Tax=Haliangium sp. UPWRP_2 TaxID=1931276 RepID=UPI000B53A8C9|nr:hypothetical protein [Haliangium sp. UPWRP_2]PSM31343.1 hypothetical protein BVG81_005925 [Haliangium sp. UPWRP_2]